MSENKTVWIRELRSMWERRFASFSTAAEAEQNAALVIEGAQALAEKLREKIGPNPDVEHKWILEILNELMGKE